MTKSYFLRYTLSLCLLLSVEFGTYAQVGKVLQATKDEKGVYNHVQFDAKKAPVSLSNIKQVFQAQLNLANGNDLRVKQQFVDQLGIQHTRYQQYYNGVKVEDGDYIVHSTGGIVNAMNGHYADLKTFSVKPRLSAAAALTKAIAYVGAKTYLWENAQEANMIGYTKPAGELVIINQKLAYKFDIYALNPISRSYIYVDAATGAIVSKNDIIHHANAVGSAATRYSGTRSINTDSYNNGYRLRDYSRGSGIETYNMKMGINYSNAVDFTDTDNNWIELNNAAKDNAALDAHWAAGKTYDYFKTTFNRNSFNNKGAIIKSYVHFDLVEFGYPNNDNAFWDGSRMTYGDGTSLPPLTTIDVAAHEIGHAVCTYTADLRYSGESGAMNEGFSDIWGACVENFAAPEKKTWVLGEDLGTTIRSMENPNARNQPDTYKGTYWYTGSADNGGVHTNSGVLNHWFYILSVGKSGTNDKGNAFSVTGIGISKAAQIAYRLESVYLSSGSNYTNAMQYGIQAAVDLYGAGSAEAIATQNAWYAVGLGTPYSGGSDTAAPSTPGTITVSAITGSGATLTWGASTDNVAVTGYDVYVGSTQVGSTTSTTYNVTGLTASTAYTVSVKAKDAAGNQSTARTASFTTTTGSGITYCTSTGNNASSEWIDLVQLGTISNTTASNSGYGNFTSLSTNLTPGSSYTISYSAGFSSSSYNEYWSVWIDLNRDGDFADSGEQLVNRSSTSSATLTSTFTLPATASLGTTRMRVTMQYNAAPSNCGSFNYGEVEDYTVNITGTGVIASNFISAEVQQEPLLTKYSVSPNPVRDIVKISTAENTPYQVQLISLYGEVLQTIPASSNEVQVDMSKLTKGVYVISVKTEKGVMNTKVIKE
jgi:Zn-dependent metalloprotease